MMVDEIGFYIQSQGFGTLGTNLFKSFMPSNPFTLVGVYEYPGSRNQFVFGSTSAPAWERPRLQIVSRSTSYATAMKKLQGIYKSLELVSNKTLAPTSLATGCLYIRIQPISAPFTMGLDYHELLRVAVNFDVMKELST
jgi:hypothetical protein